MVTEKVKVQYTIKNLNKASLNYNVLMEKTIKFNSIREAKLFIYQIDTKNPDCKVIGKPVIYQAA